MLLTDVQRSVRLNIKEKSYNHFALSAMKYIDRLARAFTRPSLPVGTARRAEREFAAWQVEQARHANNEKQKVPHRGVSAPRDAKRGARAVRIPLFYCPIKSVQNKKSSTP